MSICVVAVKLFQIATPTVFLRFSRSLAHMIYVPMQKTGTDFQNLDFWQIFKFLILCRQNALITEYSKMMGSRTQRSSLYVDYRAVTEYASDVVI